MTSRTSHRPFRWLAILLAATLMGCTHKEIVCPAGTARQVEVLFMWDNAPGATVQGMTTFFYPLSDGAKIWRFDIPGSTGGTVELPAGRYCLLAMNNDLPGVLFSGWDDPSSLTAEARNSGSGGSLGPTGMLYGALVTDAEVTICGVSYRLPDGSVKECPAGLIRCYPDSVTTLYDVELRSVTGLENMRSAQALISGVARSIKMASRSLSDTTGSVGCTLQDSPRAVRSLSGLTTAFGIPESCRTPTLTISVIRNDGSTIAKTIDIASIIAPQRNRHHVFIRIDSLEIPSDTLPTPPDGDVGIDVGVDGWNVIDINIGT